MYGDEDQNELMAEINNYKGEDDMEEITRIEQIYRDIDNYEKAIEHAEGALAEAERELIEELEARAAVDDSMEDYPEYDD